MCQRNGGGWDEKKRAANDSAARERNRAVVLLQGKGRMVYQQMSERRETREYASGKHLQDAKQGQGSRLIRRSAEESKKSNEGWNVETYVYSSV